MKIEFLAIGSEMLSMQNLETNSILLQETFFKAGFALLRKSVIVDDQYEITTAIENAAERSDILVCSGGLGPTVDDITIESVAHAARRKIVFSQDVWERIESSLKARKRPINEGHKKQARVIEGAEIFINKTGQAPAQYLQIDQLHIFLLPGVPGEFKAFLDEITARIITISGKSRTMSKMVFKLAAVAEGDMDIRLKEKLGHILPGKNEELIITTKPGVQTITLVTDDKSPDDRRAEIERALKKEFPEKSTAICFSFLFMIDYYRRVKGGNG